MRTTHPSVGKSRPEIEAELRGVLEYNRSETLKLMLHDAPIGEVLEKIVLDAEAVLPGSICSLLLLSADGERLTYGAAPNLPDFYNAAVEGAAVALGNGSCGTAAASGTRVVVEDVATHPYWSAYAELTRKAELGACWSHLWHLSQNRLQPHRP